ncbi:MAG: type IV pilus assembly protein PilM [Deltaproteobacteria bacterium]|nr:type IV pilus assembly protein PilM [Deltaproteobacteria bacterium]
MSPFFRKNLVGVDIGSCSIKVVKFLGGSGKYELDTATSIKSPTHGEGGEGIAGIIGDIVRSKKVRGRSFAISLPGSRVTIRHLNLPVMPEKDLKEAVAWEMRKETNLPSEELLSDFMLLDEINQPEGSRYSIIAFGSRRGEVDNLIRNFEGIPGEVVAVDVTPLALLASFDLNTQWEKAVNYAVIDIGGMSTTLAILKDKKMRFTREIAVGGREMTLSIAHGRGIGEDEAEADKVEFGLGHGGNGEQKTREFLLPVVDRLTNEINLSFDYYQAQFREGVIGKIFISGGSSLLKGLDDYISNAFNVPCFVDDPLRGVEVPKRLDAAAIRRYAPAFSVAVGLATRRG